MYKDNKKNNINNFINTNKNKKGSALLMGILILSSIIAVSFSVSRMVMTAIETGGVQAQSVISYYTAEAGAERVLYGIRKGSIDVDTEDDTNIFDEGDNFLTNGSEYKVFVTQYNPLKIINLGSFKTTKRSVELSF